MRQHLSLLMLAAGSTIYKILLLLALMAAGQSLLFYQATQKGLAAETPLPLEEIVTSSHMIWLAGGAFLILMVLLTLTGTEFKGSKLRYTLGRLAVDERVAVLWWTLYNAICIFVFLVVELLLVYVLGRFYLAKMDGAFINQQSLWLAFYRNKFMHGLLPLADKSLYARNIVFTLSLGLTAACFSFRQRRDKWGIAVVIMTALVLVTFPQRMGAFDSHLAMSFIALTVAAVAYAGIWGVWNNENQA